MKMYPPLLLALESVFSRRGFCVKSASVLGLMVLFAVSAASAVRPVWVTSGKAFVEGKSWETFVQPTQSKLPASGLFGSTREGGERFHEGLDIAPEERDAQGRAKDRIFAVLDGEVVHVSRDASKSSYGQYVVIKHIGEDLPVYSLYAHMASIDSLVQPHVRVPAGARLGIMGNTAGGYEIPHERAHLHFEMGVRLTDAFQPWYDEQDFDDPNAHGLWNGMNLVSLNALKFFGQARVKGISSMAAYVRDTLPSDFTLRIFTSKTPDFVQRYPGLLTRRVPLAGVSGWTIDFTWYGLPKRWTPLPKSPHGQRQGVEILRYREHPMFHQGGRLTLVRDESGNIRVGKHLQQYLDLLFDTHHRGF